MLDGWSEGLQGLTAEMVEGWLEDSSNTSGLVRRTIKLHEQCYSTHIKLCPSPHSGGDRVFTSALSY